MKNAGLRYDGVIDLDWIPFMPIEFFFMLDKKRGEYGSSGRSFVPKEYLRIWDVMMEETGA